MHKKTLIIIDAYNFLFRAFYAIPNLTNNNGMPVGAVYGFINMIFKHIENPPDYMVIACDTGKKTFRDLIYPEYKINRGEAPEDLCVQFPLFNESIEAFDLISISRDGYEADDIIATLATRFASADLEIIIFSSDKDLVQLMSKYVKIFDPIKNKLISEEDVIKKFGVKPSQILDFLSLTGDSSDNIPGVKGIGSVTAAKLINEFNTLENLFLNVESLKKSKIKENLINFKEHAFISKQLISLDNNVDIEKKLDDFKIRPLNRQKVLQFLQENNFKNILQRIEKIFSTTNNDEKHFDKIILNFEQFNDVVKQSGIISVKQIFNDILLKTALYQKNQYAVFKFNILDITDEIKDFFLDLSILKIIDVQHNFFHEISINSWHSIKVILHTLNSSDSDKYYDVADTLQLYTDLIYDLFKKKLFFLYFSIEKPILSVIISMEKKGIMVDLNILHNLSLKLTDEMKIIEQEIFLLSGNLFNLSSPKQISEVLFEKMKIPYPFKTKKHSTDAEIMEALEESGNEIATKILKWRTFNKLKTTYTDSLIKHVNKDTGRIHTTYSSIGTNTGRFSSSNPNLQNIPRNKKIKSAFIAKSDHYLVSADYSQIEIRIISYLANIQNFKKILAEGGDIHLFTANQIFSDFSNSTIIEDLRQKAKAINFGIMYGITPFGLAKQLKITTNEAKQYIDLYFMQYPEIKDYMQKIKEFAELNGYVTTKYGRRCNIKEINSNNFVLRGIAQRSAINAPIQGTAADIIKKAMVKIDKSELSNYLVMQIHDEVILEIPKEKLNTAKNILTNIMESIDEDLNLKISISFGENLADLEEVT